ncbi:MAG: energy-coupling factor transporter transmembrane protein EcfT, partial [Peptostreptococcaceae bacterium]|nr:energy-coupling factor transporter transmembrane protein EcfT [Peptostreptococcaceae bacterium]
IPLLIPLFISAFRIAQDLAMAMEARCYSGGENRTRMTAMAYEKRDAFATLGLMTFVAVIILERILI